MFGLHLMLLLTFWSLPVNAVHTKFHVHGDFYCEYEYAKQKDFILDVRVIEQDFWFVAWFDDDITTDGTLKLWREERNETLYLGNPPLWPRTINFSIEAEDTGDGPGDDYEIYLAIRHTCTFRRDPIWIYEKPRRRIPIKDGDVDVRWTGNITNNTYNAKKRKARKVEEKKDSEKKKEEEKVVEEDEKKAESV